MNLYSATLIIDGVQSHTYVEAPDYEEAFVAAVRKTRLKGPRSLPRSVICQAITFLRKDVSLFAHLPTQQPAG